MHSGLPGMEITFLFTSSPEIQPWIVNWFQNIARYGSPRQAKVYMGAGESQELDEETMGPKKTGEACGCLWVDTAVEADGSPLKWALEDPATRKCGRLLLNGTQGHKCSQKS